MMAEELTLGELSRTLAKLEAQVSQGFSRIERQIDNMGVGDLRIEITRLQAELTSATGRVEVLEERAKWFTRTVTGAIVGYIVTAALTVLLVRGGM